MDCKSIEIKGRRLIFIGPCLWFLEQSGIPTKVVIIEGTHFVLAAKSAKNIPTGQSIISIDVVDFSVVVAIKPRIII